MTTPEFLSEVNAAINIYEDAIGNFASRTRKMIGERGAVNALARLVQSPDLQKGFKVLRDRGELESTFEAVIVRHSDLFQSPVVEAAQWRLTNAQELL